VAAAEAALIAALAGVVVALGISEVAFSARRRLDASSPWVAAWCGAVALYLAGRLVEELYAAELGARLRFVAAVPLAALAVGVVRARARSPLSNPALAALAGGALVAVIAACLAPLDLVVALTGAAIVLLFIYAVSTLIASRVLTHGRRAVSLAVVVAIGAAGLNDVLLQLGLLRSVHLVELALVGLPLLHNVRLVRRMHTSLDEAHGATQVARSQLEDSRRQLEHAERLGSLGTMAAGVAHEINNPLSFVIANLLLLDEQLGAAGDTARCVLARDAIEGASRVQRIARDLKAFSATTCDELEWLDLDESVDSAMHLLNGLLRHRATVERVRLAAPRVHANRVRLGQVVMNLLRNAVEALPEVAARNRIRVITGATSDGQGFVTIADNGPGIAPDVLPRIFDPFFTTKPAGVGTGLGLSICHGIIDTMGGRIVVDGRPGEGASFTVFLVGQAGRREATGGRP
jgi:signal transduction histidine kinase